MAKQTELWAKIGITVQFLALVRSLGEYLRLKAVYSSSLTIPQVELYVVGGFIAALLCWLAVTLFFFRQYGLVVAVSVATVIVLVVYKIVTTV